MSAQREEFKQYCLRRLGAPVIQINVADEQLEDRIDDAIQFYREHHFDGTERLFMIHQVTAQNKIDKYIDVPEHIDVVVRVINYETVTRLNDGLFDARYQYMLNEVFNLTNTDLVTYDNAMKQLNLVDQIIGKGLPIRFNKNKHRIEMPVDWTEIAEGTKLVFEMYGALDPETWTDVYNDRWLKAYCTALIKLQWGNNLSKFAGVALPGGITLDGPRLITEAEAEIATLKEEMKDAYMAPLDFFIG